MKKALFALMAVPLLMAGCTGGKQDSSPNELLAEEDTLPERYVNDDLPPAADELFDDFVYYFASNEQLQRRRIDFPLEVSGRDGQLLVSEQQWTLDPLFMETGEYTLIFNAPEERELVNDTTLEQVVVEKIFLTADSVRQYHFMRQEGRWQLKSISLMQLADHPGAPFLKFYQQFATDTVFQQNSLCREIEFAGPDPDDDFAQMEGFISPDSWGAFAPELPSDSIYSIVYGTLRPNARERILVVCGISNGMETEITFRKRGGKWKLAKLTE